MSDEERCQRQQSKRPADRNGTPMLSGSARSVSALLSLPRQTDANFLMLLSEINKAFADVGKLTSPDSWPMWRFRIDTAMSTILNFYTLRAGLTVPQEVQQAVFNVISGILRTL